MTIFNDLLSLYKKHGASQTPKEDYCTECLASILRSNSDILQLFVKKVLGINTDKIGIVEPIEVYTQRSYRTIEGELGIVDLVFESEMMLCFLEMKVESGEGYKQLEKYQQILKERPNAGINLYLRYCSLYVDEKEGYDNFHQFQWVDIANFLKHYTKENYLVNEFYQFLKENRMTGNERFTHEDLVGSAKRTFRTHLAYCLHKNGILSVFSIVVLQVYFFFHIQLEIFLSASLILHYQYL